MNLVPDWKQWHRWWSMRWTIVTTFLAAIPTAYAVMPDDWLPSIPNSIKAGLAMATMLSAGASGVARLLKQPNLPP